VTNSIKLCQNGLAHTSVMHHYFLTLFEAEAVHIFITCTMTNWHFIALGKFTAIPNDSVAGFHLDLGDNIKENVGKKRKYEKRENVKGEMIPTVMTRSGRLRYHAFSHARALSESFRNRRK